ncbi:hypothetical protein Syun_013925 [Stephania yunnanensis]|uniref:Uncharacterized protein n=1 Tax=Stephania yunnanensis TaxID=152371 RepID=A0AAP0JKF8_9MAGN
MCVQLDELSVGMTELLRIYGITLPNCQKDHIVFEETEGNFSSGRESEFEDEENYVNFDKPPKFDDDDQGFIEDTVVVFGDEGRVVTNIPLSKSSQMQVVVDDVTVNQCFIEVVTILPHFEDKVILNRLAKVRKLEDEFFRIGEDRCSVR